MARADEWVELIGEPERAPDPIDWTQVESVLDTALPADYRSLVETFPALVLEGFLRILHPTGGSEYNNWTQVAPRALEALREARSRGNIKFPHGIHPESPGLLLWGSTINGDYCLWLTSGEPDEWTVVITNLHRWWEFEGGLFEFVSGFLSEKVRVPFFPDDAVTGEEHYQEP